LGGKWNRQRGKESDNERKGKEGKGKERRKGERKRTKGEREAQVFSPNAYYGSTHLDITATSSAIKT